MKVDIRFVTCDFGSGDTNARITVEEEGGYSAKIEVGDVKDIPLNELGKQLTTAINQGLDFIQQKKEEKFDYDMNKSRKNNH